LTADLLIVDGRIVLPEGVFDGCVVIDNGVIVALGSPSSMPKADRTLDASGKIVMPGVIDAHMHLRTHYGELDDYASGTLSAASGGMTTVIDFALPMKNQDILEVFTTRKMQGERNALIDFGLHMCLISGTSDELTKIPELVNLGIGSFKFFMTYSEDVCVNDGFLLEILKAAGKAGGVVNVHAENDSMIQYYNAATARMKADIFNFEDSRPSIAEAEAISRAALYAGSAGTRLHISHISSKEGATAVGRLKGEGANLTGETCPQYLVLTSSSIKRKIGGLMKVCPPIRSEEDSIALWQGLQNRSIDMVTTDHSPMRLKSELQQMYDNGNIWAIPPGVPGLETMLPLMLSEGVAKSRLTMPRLAELVSTNSAKVFGLYPKKGVIRVGSDADLTIVDMKKKTIVRADQLHSKADYTPYEGMELKGAPVTTISRGEIIAENGYPGTIVGRLGRGRFVGHVEHNSN